MNRDILSMTFEELSDEFVKLGFPKFRAKQIYEWLHKHLAGDYDEMSNIPKNLREDLKEKFPITDDVIEVWRTKGLSSYDKYSLTYFVVSHYLKVLRYRAKCLDKEN